MWVYFPYSGLSGHPFGFADPVDHSRQNVRNWHTESFAALPGFIGRSLPRSRLLQVTTSCACQSSSRRSHQKSFVVASLESPSDPEKLGHPKERGQGNPNMCEGSENPTPGEALNFFPYRFQKYRAKATMSCLWDRLSSVPSLGLVEENQTEQPKSILGAPIWRCPFLRVPIFRGEGNQEDNRHFGEVPKKDTPIQKHPRPFCHVDIRGQPISLPSSVCPSPNPISIKRGDAKT